MQPRERIQAVLAHKTPDRPPRFEIWIDALLPELGQTDLAAAHANLGQDCIMLPGRGLPGSNAWRSGLDEWGQVWRNGMYVAGIVDSKADLARYSPDLALVEQLFDRERAAAIRRSYPDHSLIYGAHIGPFMAAYMAMSFERFFFRLMDDPGFIEQLLTLRTDWAIAQFQQAIHLGAEIIVVGDDAAHRGGPMISPAMWRRVVLPQHRRLVAALDVPVIWHSDGDVRSLLPMAIEAGFSGVHGLEPAAGIDLAEVKAQFGQALTLIGNVDVNVLCPDPATPPGQVVEAVRREVDRSLAQGGDRGYMLATCNSIFDGMDAVAVAAYFRCAASN